MARACSDRAKTAEFTFYAPQAKKVSLAGSFNNWDTKALTAKRDSRGNWTVKASLKPGRHEYKFFVDGTWVSDPRCSKYVPNAFGSSNCVVEIR